MAKITRTAIHEAIKGRGLAWVAGATIFGQDYTAVEAQFLALTREIEDDNLSYARRIRQSEQFRKMQPIDATLWAERRAPRTGPQPAKGRRATGCFEKRRKEWRSTCAGGLTVMFLW